MTERNFHIVPPRTYEDTIARWHKHAAHILANAKVYPTSLVDLAWRFMKQHG